MRFSGDPISILNPVIDSSGQKIPEITAFVFEPGSSSGLVHFPPKELVNEIVRETRKHGGYVISNEVTTGTGRTGKWFGFSHQDFIPDVAAIAKGLGSGYPVSCVVIEDEHIEYFLDSLEEILSIIKQ